jgi:hypothetical protein
LGRVREVKREEGVRYTQVRQGDSKGLGSGVRRRRRSGAAP